MKALLIDDERLARQELRRLLAAHPDIEVVGEAANAGQARERMAALAPDLLFLDVQMPGETGMELLDSLEPPAPQVIFTTAFDEFAARAFALNAVDYLLKPVDPARLNESIQRLGRRGSGADGAEAATGSDDSQAAGPGAAGPPAQARGRLAHGDKVFVRENERCWFVEVGQIRLLESEGNYTRVHFGEVQPQLFRSLNAMEARLDPKVFFRANRRQIINLGWIAGIEPWFSGGLLVELKGGVKVELSRRQAQEFRERMSL
jgi:two-component system LytT family response regulator